jgi:hypothetical protein
LQEAYTLDPGNEVVLELIATTQEAERVARANEETAPLAAPTIEPATPPAPVLAIGEPTASVSAPARASLSGGEARVTRGAPQRSEEAGQVHGIIQLGNPGRAIQLDPRLRDRIPRKPRVRSRAPAVFKFELDPLERNWFEENVRPTGRARSSMSALTSIAGHTALAIVGIAIVIGRTVTPTARASNPLPMPVLVVTKPPDIPPPPSPRPPAVKPASNPGRPAVAPVPVPAPSSPAPVTAPTGISEPPPPPAKVEPPPAPLMATSNLPLTGGPPAAARSL